MYDQKTLVDTGLRILTKYGVTIICKPWEGIGPFKQASLGKRE